MGSRSSKVNDFGINRNGIWNILFLIIVTVCLSRTVSDIYGDLNAENRLWRIPPSYSTRSRSWSWEYAHDSVRQKARYWTILVKAASSYVPPFWQNIGKWRIDRFALAIKYSLAARCKNTTVGAISATSWPVFIKLWLFAVALIKYAS